MLGNYLYGLFLPKFGGLDVAFQGLLIACCFLFSFGSIITSSFSCFLLATVIHIFVGGYWPSIGALRGRYILPELRSTSVNMARTISLIITVLSLSMFAHSSSLMMMVCALLTGAATYLQSVLGTQLGNSENEVEQAKAESDL